MDKDKIRICTKCGTQFRTETSRRWVFSRLLVASYLKH